MALPSQPPGADPGGDPRPGLWLQLDALGGLIRRHVGGERIAVVLQPATLAALAGGAEAPTLAVSDRVELVASGPAAQALRARPGAAAWADGGLALFSTGEGEGLALEAVLDEPSHEVLAMGQALAGVAMAAVANAAELVAARARIRELDELAVIDALTGLGNRRHLDRILPVEILRRRRYQRPLTVMMLDLDRFKAINDAYGHSGGDAVLRALSDLLRSALRAADVGVRYGGEEFAVVLPETSGEGAAFVAERIRRATEALVVDGMRVTISIGVASVEGTWEGDAEALLRAADQALYRAKREGRNRIVYTNLAEGSTDSSPRVGTHRLRDEP